MRTGIVIAIRFPAALHHEGRNFQGNPEGISRQSRRDFPAGNYPSVVRFRARAQPPLVGQPMEGRLGHYGFQEAGFL